MGDAPTAAQIGLASPADDAELLEFMKTTTLPGEITLAMQREPSLFAAAPVLGHVHQVFVSRVDGRIVGMAERAERRLYVNGAAANVGYLSGVRLMREHRHGKSLFKGFRFLRGLHESGAASLYLTTIARGNEEARAILTSGRAGLPAYHKIGSYVTAAIPVRRSVEPEPLPGGEVRPAHESDLDALVEFWRDTGARRQLFPAIERGDFALARRLDGLAPGDVWTAWRGGRLVGTLARWDQHRYKQWQLVGYGWRMTLARPFFRVLSAALGWPAIPPPGTRVRAVYGALGSADGDDHAVVRALLTALVAAERARGGAYVALGLMEGDPWLAAALDLRAFTMGADVYLVAFDEAGESARRALDGRPFYVELGTL